MNRNPAINFIGTALATVLLFFAVSCRFNGNSQSSADDTNTAQAKLSMVDNSLSLQHDGQQVKFLALGLQKEGSFKPKDSASTSPEARARLEFTMQYFFEVKENTVNDVKKCKAEKVTIGQPFKPNCESFAKACKGGTLDAQGCVCADNNNKVSKIAWLNDEKTSDNLCGAGAGPSTVEGNQSISNPAQGEAAKILAKLKAGESVTAIGRIEGDDGRFGFFPGQDGTEFLLFDENLKHIQPSSTKLYEVVLKPNPKANAPALLESIIEASAQ